MGWLPPIGQRGLWLVNFHSERVALGFLAGIPVSDIETALEQVIAGKKTDISLFYRAFRWSAWYNSIKLKEGVEKFISFYI